MLCVPGFFEVLYKHTICKRLNLYIYTYQFFTGHITIKKTVWIPTFTENGENSDCNKSAFIVCFYYKGNKVSY